MVEKNNQRLDSHIILLIIIMGMLLNFSPLRLFSQEMPPRPISARFIQNLSFGAFSVSLSGGTVTVTSTGIRYATGGIILVGMGYLYFPAIFGLEGNPGTIIHVLNGPDGILTGSNGGSMTLHLGEASPGDPIILNVAPPGYMQILLGGNLIVGSLLANPSGFYSGTFSLMFIQE